MLCDSGRVKTVPCSCWLLALCASNLLEVLQAVVPWSPAYESIPGSPHEMGLLSCCMGKPVKQFMTGMVQTSCWSCGYKQAANYQCCCKHRQTRRMAASHHELHPDQASKRFVKVRTAVTYMQHCAIVQSRQWASSPYRRLSLVLDILLNYSI